MSILSRIFGWFAGSAAPARLPSPDDTVLLTEPAGEVEANLFRDMLEQDGIRSMIRNIDASSAQAGGMGPVWAYQLLVLRKDLRRAREILGLPE